MHVCPKGAHATHIMGVDISYQCLSGCTYRVTHKTYYDCTGGIAPPPPGTPPVPFINFIGTPIGCNTIPLATGAWVVVSYMEVTPICAGFQTGCTNASSPINGVREAIYRRDCEKAYATE